MREETAKTTPGRMLLITLACAAASVLLWFPLALHNLPVAANVDERNGLAVLTRFHNGDLNPHFFFYPTLFYYFDYLLTAIFGYHHLLFSGRILNLALVGAVAAAAFFLAVSATGKRIAGWASAALILSSPLLASSGSYLDTDVLLSWATALSLAFFVRFFRGRASRDWMWAVLFCGVAVGCKYTALVLYIAYLFTEWLTPEPEATAGDWLSRTHLSRRGLVGSILALAVVFGLVATFFPIHQAMAFIQAHRTNVNAKSASGYITFFHSLRRKFALLAGALFLLAACTARFHEVRRRLSPVRLYLGFAIVCAILIASTPFALVTPVRFVYDAGSLLKNNVAAQGGHAQWGSYLHWFLQSESWAAGILAIAGAFLLARAWRSWGILYVYVLLYAFTIGSAYRGFPRYLPPLLPAIFCFAGYALVLLLERIWGRWLLAACLVSIFFWHTRHIAELRRDAALTTEDYRAYNAALAAHPRRVFYAGDAPVAELQAAGYPIQEISWSQAASPAFWQNRACNDLVILGLNAPPADASSVQANLTHIEGWSGVQNVAGTDREELFLKQPCP